MSYYEDKERDLTNHLVIELKNNTLHLEKKKTNRGWILWLSMGSLPDKFNGQYASFREAKIAADNYIAMKRYKSVEKIKPFVKEANG